MWRRMAVSQMIVYLPWVQFFFYNVGRKMSFKKSILSLSVQWTIQQRMIEGR